MIKQILENSGFTDIEQAKDGKYNASKGSQRFFGLVITDIKGSDIIDTDSSKVSITSPNFPSHIGK